MGSSRSARQWRLLCWTALLYVDQGSRAEDCLKSCCYSCSLTQQRVQVADWEAKHVTGVEDVLMGPGQHHSMY